MKIWKQIFEVMRQIFENPVYAIQSLQCLEVDIFKLQFIAHGILTLLIKKSEETILIF